MKISIIIPNFNGATNLKNNLPHVLKAVAMSRYVTEVIVVDDASTDNSLSQLKLYLALRVIENKKNQGFAAACNIGVKEATGDVVVLLNSDVYPAENFLDFLIFHFEKDERVFAVGCLEKVLNYNNQIVEERGVGKLYFNNGIFQHRAGDINSGVTDWVCGGSGAFRKRVFLALGGFDLRFAPFYWEDIDLSYRGKLAGYKLLFEKNSVVYHKHTEGSIAKHHGENEIKKISFRNQIKFTEKHLGLNFFRWLQFAFFVVKLKIESPRAN